MLIGMLIVYAYSRTRGVLSCGPPPPLLSERRGTGSKQNIPLLKEMTHPIYPRLSTFIPSTLTISIRIYTLYLIMVYNITGENI